MIFKEKSSALFLRHGVYYVSWRIHMHINIPSVRAIHSSYAGVGSRKRRCAATDGRHVVLLPKQLNDVVY